MKFISKDQVGITASYIVVMSGWRSYMHAHSLSSSCWVVRERDGSMCLSHFFSSLFSSTGIPKTSLSREDQNFLTSILSLGRLPCSGQIYRYQHIEPHLYSVLVLTVWTGNGESKTGNPLVWHSNFSLNCFSPT